MRKNFDKGNILKLAGCTSILILATIAAYAQGDPLQQINQGIETYTSFLTGTAKTGINLGITTVTALVYAATKAKEVLFGGIGALTAYNIGMAVFS